MLTPLTTVFAIDPPEVTVTHAVPTNEAISWVIDASLDCYVSTALCNFFVAATQLPQERPVACFSREGELFRPVSQRAVIGASKTGPAIALLSSHVFVGPTPHQVVELERNDFNRVTASCLYQLVAQACADFPLVLQCLDVSPVEGGALVAVRAGLQPLLRMLANPYNPVETIANMKHGRRNRELVEGAEQLRLFFQTFGGEWHRTAEDALLHLARVARPENTCAVSQYELARRKLH